MNAAIVFTIDADGGWSILDFGPELLMFVRYRLATVPGQLCMLEFENCWPVRYRKREP